MMSSNSLKMPLADEGLHGPPPDLSAHTDADVLRRQRWAAARFGMFSHWGLSALCGGWWKGQQIPGLAEWIQFKARIPMAEYAKLAAEFNPVGFDAREWIRLAAESGAKYFVFTAKHHDGFAMYHSTVSRYNIVDATPFGRDVLAELADACRAYGIMLGLYYSQMIDWEDADAVGPSCNDWDFDIRKADFHRYWQRKAMPQLKELLTRYGEIGLLWFDMPKGIPPECAKEASDLVRRLQPSAVINSRLGGGGIADYQSMDDNYFNNDLPDRDWETAATTNGSWGYAKDPGDWKPDAALCEAIAYSVSRGGNYLLNIGADGEGRLPARTISQFQAIGRWMQRAAPAIHGASSSPFAGTFEWGSVTSRDASIYVHISDSKCSSVSLPTLMTKPARAIDLGAQKSLDLEQLNGSTGWRVRLAPASDDLPRTIQLQLGASAIILPTIAQAPGESLRLDIWRATRPAAGVLRWDFTLSTPGRFRVILLSKQTFAHSEPRWHGKGLKGTLIAPSSQQPFVLADEGREPYPIIHFWQLFRSELGTFTAETPGTCWLELHDLPICDSKWDETAVNAVGVRLEPEKSNV
jgi:alpha-L-fucosidase